MHSSSRRPESQGSISARRDRRAVSYVEAKRRAFTRKTLRRLRKGGSEEEANKGRGVIRNEMAHVVIIVIIINIKGEREKKKQTNEAAYLFGGNKSQLK